MRELFITAKGEQAKVSPPSAYLWVVQKPQMVLVVHVQEFLLGTAYGRHDDDAPLLSLEFLHAAHFDLIAKTLLLYHGLDLLHLNKRTKYWSTTVKWLSYFDQWIRRDPKGAVTLCNLLSNLQCNIEKCFCCSSGRGGPNTWMQPSTWVDVMLLLLQLRRTLTALTCLL